MKSILFTLFRNKLLSGKKDQTFRCLFVPKKEPGDIVKIDYRDEFFPRATLFLAKITELYPRQIKDFTLEEANRDGFKSVIGFQAGIMKMHNLKSKNQWGFIIRFTEVKGTKITTIEDFLRNPPLDLENE